MENPSIFAQTPAGIKSFLADLGEPKFRAAQLVDWLFAKRQPHLDQMVNIPAKLRKKLSESFSWDLPEVVSEVTSQDGATKLLLRSARNQNQVFEAVILRYENRVSLCVSSQVGCKLACSFCQTGKLGFFRNLGPEEILGQFLLANQIVAREERRITHLVFRGLGEPLDNYDSVVRAVNNLTDPDAFGISPSRVTVSTSGIVPKIKALAEDVKASLAISLHASRDDLRTELMPINRKYNLAKLKEALLEYQQKTGQKITIEYILIGSSNCGKREAKELVRFLHGLKAKVNLIPFNAHPGLPCKRPEEIEIREFQKYLADRSIPAPVRYSKGLEVSAACGQLAAKVQENLGQAPARKNVVYDHPAP